MTTMESEYVKLCKDSKKEANSEFEAENVTLKLEISKLKA
jgi:hypothetical protein